jgi:hypothetical protein
MTAKMPPVPPEQQSHKGPGDDKRPDPDTTIDKRPENLDEEGRWGNIKQNTTNQGHGQGR